MMTTLRWKLLIGGCATIAGVLLILIRDWLPQSQKILLLSILLIMGGLSYVVFLLMKVWYDKKSDVSEVIEDERILKIKAYTFMKAFLFSFTVVCILGILNFSRLWVMDARSVILIIIFAMGGSSSLLSWYYYRQGDINGK